MSAETLGERHMPQQVNVLTAGSVVTLDAAQHAEYVTQHMMALAENIETLLQTLEAAQLRSRHLRERWGLVRQQLQRSRPVRQPGTSQADFERALASWQERMTQTQRDMLAEEALLRTQMQRTREQLQQQQQELKGLMEDALPAAQRRDAQRRLAQLVEQQHQLERELDALHAELLAQELHKQAHDALQTQSGAHQQTEVGQPKAGLGSAANSNDDDVLQGASSELSQDQRDQLTPIVQLVGDVLQSQRGGNRSGAKLSGGGTVPISAATAVLQSRWGEHISKMNVDGWMDVNQLIQWVMREAYITNTEDLRGYAYRVKYFTDLKRSIREELMRARGFLRDNIVTEGGTKLATSYDMRKFSTVPDTDPRTGALMVRAPEDNGQTDDPKVLDNYIREMEQLLNTVGDDAQLAQVDLQNVTQKQQQTLQTLSNLSKVLHETSMAIIRKIGS